MSSFIRAENVKKTFQVGDQDIQVLKDVNVEIEKGDFAIIFGPSGSGKSTLLHCLLGLEHPSEGKIIVDDKDFYAMSEDERAIFRRHRVGMIYQQALWINSMNVFENVVFALHLLDYNKEMVKEKGEKALKSVGMEGWANYRPRELSSGQQQKISLARALVIDPILVVADEPTGNLDTVSGQNLINTFMDLNSKGLTIMMITHDLTYLKFASKLVHMLDGKVVEVYKPKNRAKATNTAAGSAQKSSDNGPSLHDPDYLKKLQL